MKKWFKRSLLFAFAFLLAFVPVLSVNASAVEGFSDKLHVYSGDDSECFPIPDSVGITDNFAYFCIFDRLTFKSVGCFLVVPRSGADMTVETIGSSKSLCCSVNGYFDVYSFENGKWSAVVHHTKFTVDLPFNSYADLFLGSDVDVIRDFDFQDVSFFYDSYIEAHSTSVPSVFTSVMSWLASLVSGLIVMFYVNGSLTFLGFLAVGGLALGVLLLIFMLISRFMRFGG